MEAICMALPVLTIWAMIIVAGIGYGAKYVIAAWRRSK